MRSGRTNNNRRLNFDARVIHQKRLSLSIRIYNGRERERDDWNIQQTLHSIVVVTATPTLIIIVMSLYSSPCREIEPHRSMADRIFLIVFVFVTWSVSNKKPLGFIFFLRSSCCCPVWWSDGGKHDRNYLLHWKRGAAVKLGGTKLAGKEIRAGPAVEQVQGFKNRRIIKDWGEHSKRWENAGQTEKNGFWQPLLLPSQKL